MRKKNSELSTQITNVLRCPGNKNGFTLVEVMIAMVILLVGMLGVLSMQYYAITGNASSREVRAATNLSAEIIEQLKSTPYANLSQTPAPPP